MNSVSKVKIAVGYTLLLAVMFFSLFFVNREMENLMLSDDRDIQWTDSLLTLLREKDTNTIRMLRTLSEANESMVSTSDIEHIIAEQDSVVTRQRVQHRIISHRDTVVTRPKKKGFFRRLGEVFVPPKKDTAIQVKTSLEFATDTVIAPYNPADSLHEKLRAVAQQKKAVSVIVQQRKRNLQRLDHMLTARGRHSREYVPNRRTSGYADYFAVHVHDVLWNGSGGSRPCQQLQGAGRYAECETFYLCRFSSDTLYGSRVAEHRVLPARPGGRLVYGQHGGGYGGIGNGHHKFSVLIARSHCNAAMVRKLYGIGQQVIDNLAQPQRVRDKGRIQFGSNLTIQRQPLGGRLRPRAFHCTHVGAVARRHDRSR